MKRRRSDREFEAAKERERQEEAQMRGRRSRATSPTMLSASSMMAWLRCSPRC
jgi:hypothetical protein